MSAITGTAQVRILAQHDNRPPIEIGTLLIPVTAHAPKDANRVELTIDTALTRRDLKNALRRAARTL